MNSLDKMEDYDHLKQERDELAAQVEVMRGYVDTLWEIIDDIDTATDIAKSDNELYRGIVERRQADRWKTGITTDGQSIHLSPTQSAALREIQARTLEEAAVWFDEQAYRETSWSASRASAEIQEMAAAIRKGE